MGYPSILLTIVLLAQAPGTGPVSATATLSVAIGSQARVSLAASTLVFPDADPDSVPLVPGSPELTIATRVRAPKNQQIALTVQALDDLRSGITTIPATLIRWEGRGDGFVAGVLSRTAPQLVGEWTGSGARTGVQSFSFENSWAHPPGTYSVTFVYTMSMP